MMDYESEREIERLESVLSHLNDVIGELQDCSYFDYLIGGYEDDTREIQQRLDELYAMQNEEWESEMRYQNQEYEEGRL